MGRPTLGACLTVTMAMLVGSAAAARRAMRPLVCSTLPAASALPAFQVGEWSSRSSVRSHHAPTGYAAWNPAWCDQSPPAVFILTRWRHGSLIRCPMVLASADTPCGTALLLPPLRAHFQPAATPDGAQPAQPAHQPLLRSRGGGGSSTLMLLALSVDLFHLSRRHACPRG